MNRLTRGPVYYLLFTKDSVKDGELKPLAKCYGHVQDGKRCAALFTRLKLANGYAKERKLSDCGAVCISGQKSVCRFVRMLATAFDAIAIDPPSGRIFELTPAPKWNRRQLDSQIAHPG